MKEISLRIKSIEGTRQITKAMELVARLKLSKALDGAEKCRPYFLKLRRTLSAVASSGAAVDSDFCREPSAKEDKKICIIALAGDRGLAGGYNSNLFKACGEFSQGKNVEVLPVGKKACEHFARIGADVVSSEYQSIESMDVGDAHDAARLLCGRFLSGEFEELYLIYTRFVSMLSQVPATMRLLPLEKPKKKDTQPPYMLIEPSAQAVFDKIVPDGVAGLIWGAVCESKASEYAARRIAMENATSNADDMTEQLRLVYNKARKGSITRQITEIVSGAQSE